MKKRIRLGLIILIPVLVLSGCLFMCLFVLNRLALANTHWFRSETYDEIKKGIKTEKQIDFDKLKMELIYNVDNHILDRTERRRADDDWDRMCVFQTADWNWENVREVMGLSEKSEKAYGVISDMGNYDLNCIAFAKGDELITFRLLNTFDVDIKPKQQVISRSEAVFKVSRSWDFLRSIRTINLTLVEKE